MWVRKPGEENWERARGYWYTDEKPNPYEEYEQVQQGERAIDVTGREVFVGDRIAVAVTISRSANMRVGTVISLDEIMTDTYQDEDGNWIGKPRKIGTGKFKIRCDWEASGWDQSVKTSSVEAGLPKYVKL
jgi:hypothetical protein